MSVSTHHSSVNCFRSQIILVVADKVTVITKNINDKQHIWESDSSYFTVFEDPRGNTLKRGTEIILHLTPESEDFLDQENLKKLIKKYSQFINFPIYVWASRTEMVKEDPIESDAPQTDESSDDSKVSTEDVS